MLNVEWPLRILFLALAIFDFTLGTVFIFFGEHLFSMFHLEKYALPQFFMICVGLFLYQYVYVQFMAFRNPRKYSTCMNMTVFIRLSFPFIYTSAIFLWGTPFTLLHALFAVSALADVAISIFILYSMKKMRISFFQGDETLTAYFHGPWMLRTILLCLAIAEFLISWNWMIIPEFWLRFFDIPFEVDPFWTRATGVFLFNIAYIQFLGYLNIYRYRTAVITSGLFRALWPAFYWYWTAFGSGSLSFKIFIMFFSFFDTGMCITIFCTLKKAMRRVHSGVLHG